jgi:protein SCO1/2
VEPAAGERGSAPKFPPALAWAGLAVLFALGVAAGAMSVYRRGAPPLPVLGTVPPFRLTERSGRTTSLDDLRGAPWIADFIFTRCAGTCPLLTASMARLQGKLPAAGDSPPRLVSFSVDPAYDTPEVLRSYAERFRADPNRWLFLTGERAALHDLIRNGFLLSVAESEGGRADPNEMITHSDRFVLVDARGRIRGYYHGTEEESVERLVADVERLGREAE